ncbi:hypothetical protein [Streptomyces sp. NPDC097610]|uniref:hypothetical protein n=1 Tax=Streptomyces sp. NPDC097610 TaxID=3157227 RepID=UPI0033174D73
MLTALFVIVGTLLGPAVAELFHARRPRRAEAGQRRERARSETLDVVSRLAGAVSDHRRAMYQRSEAVLSGAPEASIEHLRAESHRTQAQVAQPLTVLRLLVTDEQVRAAANAMIVATFALHRAGDSRQALNNAREKAVRAHDMFVDAAARHLQAADR